MYCQKRRSWLKWFMIAFLNWLGSYTVATSAAGSCYYQTTNQTTKSFPGQKTLQSSYRPTAWAKANRIHLSTTTLHLLVLKVVQWHQNTVVGEKDAQRENQGWICATSLQFTIKRTVPLTIVIIIVIIFIVIISFLLLLALLSSWLFTNFFLKFIYL